MTEDEAARIDPDDRLGWRTLAWKFPEGTGTIDDEPHMLWRARRYGDRKAPESVRIGCVFAVDAFGDSRMATSAEVEDTGHSFRWTVWPYAWETPYDSGYCRSMEAAKRKAEAAMVGWLVEHHAAAAQSATERHDCIGRERTADAMMCDVLESLRVGRALGLLHRFGVQMPPSARAIIDARAEADRASPRALMRSDS